MEVSVGWRREWSKWVWVRVRKRVEYWALLGVEVGSAADGVG